MWMNDVNHSNELKITSLLLLRSHPLHVLMPEKLNEFQEINFSQARLFGNWLARPLCRWQQHFTHLKIWNYARIVQHWFKSCCHLIRPGVWTSATGSSGCSMEMVRQSLRSITSFSAMRPGFTGRATSTWGSVVQQKPPPVSGNQPPFGKARCLVRYLPEMDHRANYTVISVTARYTVISVTAEVYCDIITQLIAYWWWKRGTVSFSMKGRW